MAKPKAETKPKAPKAPKAAKPEVPNAAVGPIPGTLEGQPDAVKTQSDAAPKKNSGKAGSVKGSLADKFQSIRDELIATNRDKKQPRQLRWALRALDAAEDAANRHVQHNV